MRTAGKWRIEISSDRPDTGWRARRKQCAIAADAVKMKSAEGRPALPVAKPNPLE
jgi:hypothetical protein